MYSTISVKQECWFSTFFVSQVQERYLQDGNDKLKLLVLLCGEDDDSLQTAAAGALAMLTAAEKKLCSKLTKVVCRIAYAFLVRIFYQGTKG